MASKLHAGLLKSTTIIGGSSVLNVVFRIVQTKAIALLIGPSGVGLMGLFVSTVGLASTVASVGLEGSGVREIARAAASSDHDQVATTVTVYRRLARFLALLGSLVFFMLRGQIAQLTLGSQDYAPAFGLLAFCVFFTVISGTQTALIRGMRRVGDLARATVLGIAVGTIMGLPALYLWKNAGVAPYLIVISGTTLFFAWWYARRIPIGRMSISRTKFSAEARPLLRLGLVFMSTGLIALGATYLVRVLIVRDLGLSAAGLYEAASALSNVYVGFVLGAMGADFYPHLTAVSGDNVKSTELMNAQVEVGLLVATPGILAMLALGPFVLLLLYSSSFVSAFEILRWQALGTFLRVISWPLGYILLAKGLGRWYLGTELATYLLYIPLVVIGMRTMGLAGVGLAFFGMYVFHNVLMILVARRFCGFRWSTHNLRLQVALVPVVAAAFACSFLPRNLAIVFGLLLTLGVGIYCFKALVRIVGPDTARVYYQRIRARLGLKHS